MLVGVLLLKILGGARTVRMSWLAVALASAGPLVAAERQTNCEALFATGTTGKTQATGDVQFAWTTDGSPQWRQTPAYPSVLRIGVWGDSHTASGSFVDALLQAWGFSLEGARAGQVQAAIGVPGVRLGIPRSCADHGWNLRYAYRSWPPQAGFSSSLVKLEAQDHDALVVLDFVGPDGAPAPQWLNIKLHKPEPLAALILGVSINGGPEGPPQVLKGDVHALQLVADTEIRTLRLRLIAGQLAITGFEPVYRKSPALIVDTFSTPGAQSKGWAQQKIQPSGARYDMVIFQYGTNEAPSDSYQAENYALALRKELKQFRAMHPRSMCVVMGPPDRVGLAQGGKALDYSARHQSISSIQARVSPEFHCAYWDWQKAMGGPGSIVAWSRRAEPLAQADWMHLTGQGYAESARRFAAAIPRPVVRAP